MVTDVILRRHNATPPGCHQDKVLWDVRGTPGSTRNLRERFPCADDLAFQMPDVRGGITSSSNGLDRLDHRDGETRLRASNHGHLCFLKCGFKLLGN